LEQRALHDMGKGSPNATKLALANQMVRTPLSVFNCPTRRVPGLYPNPWSGTFTGYNVAPNSANDNVITRGDYAACVGNNAFAVFQKGPTSLAGNTTYGWVDVSTPPNELTGVSYRHSETKIREVIDGLSQTIYAGEKYLNPDNYRTGMDGADNESTYCGFDNDHSRFTEAAPLRDRSGLTIYDYFGSAHAGTCNFVFCDGSVHAIAYTVDDVTFSHLGSRKDRVPVDRSKW
jgi:prepilin-type processing-associated H-X9-DG protein